MAGLFTHAWPTGFCQTREFKAKVGKTAPKHNSVISTKSCIFIGERMDARLELLNFSQQKQFIQEHQEKAKEVPQIHRFNNNFQHKALTKTPNLKEGTSLEQATISLKFKSDQQNNKEHPKKQPAVLHNTQATLNNASLTIKANNDSRN